MATDYRRKANQHWEMAGLARQDGDSADAERHTKLARMYDEGVDELEIRKWDEAYRAEQKRLLELKRNQHGPK